MPRHDDAPAEVPLLEREAPLLNRAFFPVSFALPADLRASVAELRRPGGALRLGRWLAVAAAYALAGAALCYAMDALYFGEGRLRCDGRADGDGSRRDIETFIGAVPAQARTMILVGAAVTVCRTVTGARSGAADGAVGLAAALLVVGADGDAERPCAGGLGGHRRQA